MLFNGRERTMIYKIGNGRERDIVLEIIRLILLS